MLTGQVFVSRTSDMTRFPQGRSFVQAALDAVGRAGLAPVDMRYFAARDGLPADYCRARVRECEFYVALVGFRYGSVVPGEMVSYTELEFAAAGAAGTWPIAGRRWHGRGPSAVTCWPAWTTPPAPASTHGWSP